jgi:hypothetical protein
MCFSGAPGETRTPDLLVRSQPLYPTELRARYEYYSGATRFFRSGAERGLRKMKARRLKAMEWRQKCTPVLLYCHFAV